MNRTINLFLISLALLIPALAWPQANVNETLETAFIYVDGINGNDNNPGTANAPLQTIGAAVNMAESNNRNNIGSRVIINPGIYREAVTIAPLRGATSMPITFEAARTGTVFVSGAQPYTDWTPYSGNSSVYTTPWAYAWGQCTPMAGAYLPVPDVVMRREMVFVNGTPLTQVTQFSAMSVPGTFYVDETGGTLYVWPPTGTNMATADVEVSTQPLLWDMVGQSNLVVRGLTFEYGNPCREDAEVLVESPAPVQNILFDTDNFDWSNAQGLSFGPSTSYVTVQNSTANHNGEAGFQGYQVKYALYQTDTSSFNGWRSAQGAYYAFNAGGSHFSLMHDLTLSALNSTYNQTYGIHFDTDNANVTASGELMSQNLLMGMFVERNEGPLTFSNSTFCGGSPASYLSNISFDLRDSDSVSVTGSNLVDSSESLYVTGEVGGLQWYNWETGQDYTADNRNFVSTSNVVEPVGGQDVFSSNIPDTADWQAFQSTLLSNHNTWWSESNSMAFVLPVPGPYTGENFADWQSTTGQDTQSTWADPSGSPDAACAVNADGDDFWFVVPYNQTYFTVGSGASAVWTANVVPLLNFTNNIQLSFDGTEYIPGATASWSAGTVGPTGASNLTVTTSPATPAGTYPITMIANSGGLTHTIEGLLVVDNTVTLSSRSLNFGNQAVNTSSAPESLKLTNNGSVPLSITGIALKAPDGRDFSESDNCGGSVPANSSCTMNITFTPLASGSRSSTLSITDGAPGSPQQIALTGTGTASAVSLSPISLAFAGQVVGTKSAAQTIILTNTGTASLSVTSIGLGGPNLNDFAETNTCGSSLAVNASCSISVTFDPLKTGSRSAWVIVKDNASPRSQTATLSGTGDQAAATLSPISLAFAGQVVGTKSAAQTITLTNTGTASLSVTSIGLGGPNLNDFAETNTCGSSLAVNASCSISVTFDPLKTGSRSAWVIVKDNASPSSQTSTLSGTGD